MLIVNFKGLFSKFQVTPALKRYMSDSQLYPTIMEISMFFYKRKFKVFDYFIRWFLKLTPILTFLKDLIQENFKISEFVLLKWEENNTIFKNKIILSSCNKRSVLWFHIINFLPFFYRNYFFFSCHRDSSINMVLC